MKQKSIGEVFRLISASERRKIRLQTEICVQYCRILDEILAKIPKLDVLCIREYIEENYHGALNQIIEQTDLDKPIHIIEEEIAAAVREVLPDNYEETIIHIINEDNNRNGLS